MFLSLTPPTVTWGDHNNKGLMSHGLNGLI